MFSSGGPSVRFLTRYDGFWKLWMRSELIMGDPFWVWKPLSLRIRMFE